MTASFELLKANDDLIFLKRKIEKEKALLAGIEKALIRAIKDGNGRGVLHLQAGKSTTIAQIKKLADDMVKARNNYDLWKEICQIPANA